MGQREAQSQTDAAQDMEEAYEERAAIMEYDGGLTREQAEAAARKTHPGSAW
jgi:hypothetical protein